MYRKAAKMFIEIEDGAISVVCETTLHTGVCEHRVVLQKEAVQQPVNTDPEIETPLGAPTPAAGEGDDTATPPAANPND